LSAVAAAGARLAVATHGGGRVPRGLPAVVRAMRRPAAGPKGAYRRVSR
jgi:hypothetical protein